MQLNIYFLNKSVKASISKNNCHVFIMIYHDYFEGKNIFKKSSTDGILSFQHNFMSTSVLNKYYTFTQKMCLAPSS